MDEFGLRDQYCPDMNLGSPENLFRLHQAKISANAVCLNKNMEESRMIPDEKNQRLFPMRLKSLERRVDEFEKTPICLGGRNKDQTIVKESFTSLNSPITITQETLLHLFIFIVFIFIIIHFNSAINEIKQYLSRLESKIK